MRQKLLKSVITVFLSILISLNVVSAQTQSVIIYTVQAGETLQEIAQRFNVSPSCVAEQNLLTEPVELEVGMQLTISADCPLYDGPTVESEPASGGDQGGGEATGEEYTVKRGDRLAIIARDNDVSLECLTVANNVSNPDLIYIGQTILIPEDCTLYEGQGGGGGTANGSAVRTPTGFIQLKLQPDGSYIVEYGDMLDVIALYFNVSTSCLARANGLDNPGELTPGQRIVVYPGCAPWDGPPGQVAPSTAQNYTVP